MALNLLNEQNHRRICLTVDGELAASAQLAPECWQLILPVALRDASSELLGTVLEAIKDDAKSSIPVCNDTLSAFWLAKVVMIDPELAARTAEGWMTLPLDLRMRWNPKGLGRDAIHAQVLGRTGDCSPIFSSVVPRLLPALLEFGHSAGLQPLEGVQWQYADTDIGITCMVTTQHERDACLIISDCDVYYDFCSCSRKSLSAISLLHDYLEAIETTPETIQWPIGWDPTSHELLELRATIDEWEEQICY